MEASAVGAPATTAAEVAWDVPLPAPAKVAVLGFLLGIAVGNIGARSPLFGFKDREVCLQHDTVLADMANIFNGVNCNWYQNAESEIQRNADVVPVSSFDPVTVNGVTVEYKGGVPFPGMTNDLLTCFTSSGTRPSGYRIQVDVWGAAGTTNSTGSGESNEYCGALSNLSGWWIKAPTLKFQVTLWDGTFSGRPTFQSPIVEGEVTIPDPERRWECIITTASGSYTAFSAPFHESDAQLSGLVCPALPDGETALTVKILEVGGPAERVVYQQDTTSSYRWWADNYPECRNGSCLLDLRIGGTSCFFTSDPNECDGWLANTSNYSCWYGTHPVPISGCYEYGSIFNASHRNDGTGYSDPGTGDPIDSPTSPTRADVLTAELLRTGWDSWQTATHHDGDYALVHGFGTQAETAKEVARRCSEVEGGDDECKLPIFSPGIDVLEATEHDLTAIQGGKPYMLNRAFDGAGPGDQWYANVEPCDEPRAFDENCDEYPYGSTLEGGLGASLKVINKTDNQSEGSYLLHFYSACGISRDKPTFVVVPNPENWTSIWCGDRQ